MTEKVERYEGGDIELGSFDPEKHGGAAARIKDFASEGPQMYDLASAIAKSGAYRHRNPETVLTIMLQAYELNIGIGTALKGMYPVSGKLELETWLLAGLAVMRAGVSWDDLEVSDTCARLRLHRAGWEPKVSEYNLGHASKMGLIRNYNPETHEFTFSNKATDPWFRSTEEMLYWRALSKGLKRIAPDYFGGMYVRGELSEQIAKEATATTGARDLEALLHGVEPDPDVFTDEEVHQFAREVRDAKHAGALTHQKATAMQAALERGQWAKCREDWQAMREAVLDLMREKGVEAVEAEVEEEAEAEEEKASDEPEEEAADEPTADGGEQPSLI